MIIGTIFFSIMIVFLGGVLVTEEGFVPYGIGLTSLGAAWLGVVYGTLYRMSQECNRHEA